MFSSINSIFWRFNIAQYSTIIAEPNTALKFSLTGLKLLLLFLKAKMLLAVRLVKAYLGVATPG